MTGKTRSRKHRSQDKHQLPTATRPPPGRPHNPCATPCVPPSTPPAPLAHAPCLPPTPPAPSHADSHVPLCAPRPPCMPRAPLTLAPTTTLAPHTPGFTGPFSSEHMPRPARNRILWGLLTDLHYNPIFMTHSVLKTCWLRSFSLFFLTSKEVILCEYLRPNKNCVLF